MRLAIGINKDFPDSEKENYVLDPKTCVPHITLLMGLIERDQLPEIADKLDGIVSNFSLLNLQIIDYKISERPDGKIASSLVFEKTAELQKIHEAIIEGMSSFFSYDNPKKEMFFSPPSVNELPISWVLGFAKNKVRENYSPHMSLGIGKTNSLSLPIQFKASKIALCHLGNYCTCRDILWSADLK